MNMMRNFGFFLLSLFFIGCGANDESINEANKKDSSIIPSPITEYGFVFDSFQVKRDTVKSNWTMSHMFAPYGISQWDINVAAEKAADSLIGLRYVKEGTPFIVLSALGDTSQTAEYVIYPQNIVDFVVFDFRDSVSVEKRSKPNESKRLGGGPAPNDPSKWTFTDFSRFLKHLGTFLNGFGIIFIHPGRVFTCFCTNLATPRSPTQSTCVTTTSAERRQQLRFRSLFR